MYTQCPDCSTAFRVTAEVLRQAAGKVRCGGCGNAFNALEYLSESMPEQATAPEVEESLPELKPEPLQKDDDLPKSISAEQSAALLKTLDELAGSDIRIEDTGVEWRVLDDDEFGESPVDEVLEDSPTPVDQFLTDTPAEVDAPEIFDEEANQPAQTPVEELRFDDNTPLPDDFGLDEDDAYEPLPAEEPEEEPAAEVTAEPQPDTDLSEPDEWTDILDEFEDLGEAAPMPLDAELEALEEVLADEPAAEEPVADDNVAVADEETAIADEVTEPEEPLDMDTQFALQAEAMGIDISGIYETEDAPEAESADDDLSIDELLDESQQESRELDDLLDEELVDETDASEDLELAADDDSEAEQLELIDDDDVADSDADLAELDDDLAELDDDLAELDDEVDAEDSAEADEDADEEEHDVAPLSEEEQTINLQIDADLMAIAVEDDEGFASTIIIPGERVEDKAREDDDESPVEDTEDDESEDESEDERDKKQELPLKDTSAGFETIIMEGEEIRSGREQEQSQEDAAAAAALVGAAAAEREAERKAAFDGRRWGMIAGVVLLVLILAAQAVHQKRDVLAKIPAFNDVAGPLYRAIGQPLAPQWDITGWRFEVSDGRFEEGDTDLTVYSRVGNKSQDALPYPIIAVSLTDRFEEPLGSVTLDPGDYLPNDLDPRKLVEPGNSFEAVMKIKSPPENVTGFRLRPCYRSMSGQLRCKDDSFK